jgi:hypothetical protein
MPRVTPPLSRLFLISFCCFAIAARAAVVSVEVLQRTQDDKTGYEQITGKLHFEIDPQLPGNAVIADVGLAPTNASGKVSFVADLRLWKPKDAARSNGAVWVEIPNRGGKASLSAALMAQGFTMLNVGWEFDVPAKPDALRIEVPRAQNKDGSAIRGVVSAQFTPDKPTEEQTISDLADYLPVDLEGPDSKLIVRTRAAWPGGSEISRARWSWKNHRLHLEGGFEPGKTYEIFYLSEAPPVAGLGYAAIRDAVSWLKYDATSLAPVKHAYAFGASQCGRMLRDFVYLGFDTDEQNRLALDGVMAHIAGAGRLVLNERWATPRSLASYDTASYPFADSAQRDPVSGHSEGILENSRVKQAPKIFYTNTATEYWGGGRVAALTHTNVAGTQDIAFPANVRSYFLAGTSHGPAPFPPTAQASGAPLADPINANATVNALRAAMHRWVSEGVEPPPSVYPQLADGTLTPVADIHYPKVPGIAAPNAVKAGGRVRDPLWPDGAGEGTALPLLVPQVDADGNDLGGIRMPDLAAPLGTAAGWVFRPPSMGSPETLVMLRGAWTPFAVTKAQREKTGDPRLSLEERYASKDEFMTKVSAAIQQLIERRLLLESDREPQMKQASERWDWVFQRAGK